MYHSFSLFPDIHKVRKFEIILRNGNAFVLYIYMICWLDDKSVKYIDRHGIDPVVLDTSVWSQDVNGRYQAMMCYNIIVL